MSAMAVEGLLKKFTAYEDGGGTVTLVLNDLQWREFMEWIPMLHTPCALARLRDETESAS